MNKAHLTAVLVLAMSLAACNRGHVFNKERSDLMLRPPPAAPVMDDIIPPAVQARVADMPPSQPPPPPPQPGQPPAGVALLAYSYDYGLEAPAHSVRGLLAAHEKACQAAGPKICQVTGSSVEETGDDSVSGELTLQAEPTWLAAFRARLAGEAKAAGGRLAKTSTETEDLSRQIVDTEARLKAMTTLRDRLQALLASHPGKLQELMETERELARVQGEIDSAASQAADMRARVNTSKITLSYSTIGLLAPQGAMTPLRQAFRDFGGTVIGGFAFIVRAMASLIPLGLVAAGLIWLFLRWRRGRPPLFRRRAQLDPRPSMAKSQDDEGVKP